MKTKIAVFFGGRSVEHEVSVISAIQAIMSMDTDKYDIIPVYMTKKNEMYIGEEIGKIESYKNIPALLSASQKVILINEEGRTLLVPIFPKKIKKRLAVEIDLAFPIVHGTNVEDGALQGYFKTLGLPIVGSDVYASAISMDKGVTKSVLKDAGIPVLPHKVFVLSDYADMDGMIKTIEETFGYPVIIKPVNLGSSVGIGVARDRDGLVECIDDAFRYATKVLVEHAITNLREINCAVLGDENEAQASECEEPMATDEILSYEDKYVNSASKSGSKGMASVSRKIPAPISKEMRDKIREYAVRSFKALGCNGVARIDFMLDVDKEEIYFNEINPIPGSLSFYLWEPLGMPYKELLNNMIELALKRIRNEQSLTFTFDTNILNNASLGGKSGTKGKL